MRHFTGALWAITLFILTGAILCSLPVDPSEHSANAEIHLFVSNRISDQVPVVANQGDSMDISLEMYSPRNFRIVNITSSCKAFTDVIIPDSKKSIDTVYFRIRFNVTGACTLFVEAIMTNALLKDKCDTLPFIIKSGQSIVLSPSTVNAPATIIAGVADTLFFSADNKNRPNPLRLDLINAAELIPTVFTVLRSGPDTILIAIAATTAATTSPVKIGVKTSDGVQSDTSWYPISFIDQKDALWSQTDAAASAIEGKPVIFDLRPYLVKPQNDSIGFSTNLGVVASDTTWQWTPAWGCEATASAIIVAKKGDASQDLKLSITIAEGDMTKPSIRLMNEALNGKKISSPQITVECIVKDNESGVGKVTMIWGSQGIDASMQKDSIFTALITGLSNGQPTEITISASDKSRRKNSASLVFTVTYDSTMSDEEPPAIVQSSGPESGGRVLDASGALSFTITDPSGLDSVWWSLNAVPAGKLTKQADGKYSIAYTLKTYGGNTIAIYAKDASSNHNCDSKEVTLTYNTKPSEIVVSAPANNAIDIDTLPTFTWTGGDDADGDQVVFKVMYGQAASSLTSSTGEVKDKKVALTAANKLSTATTYYWQVVAISGSKTIIDTVKSAVNSFKTIMGVGPQITVQPKAAISVNEGEALTISVEAKGQPTPTYQWYKDDAPVSGQTSAQFSKSKVTADDAGTYYVKITNGIGDGVTSTKAVITVHQKVVITQDPKEAIVTEGEKAEFTVKASGEEPLKFQWLKDGQKITGATTESYIITTVRTDNNKKISCIVSNTFSADTSAAVLLTVTPVYKVTFSDGVSPQYVKQGELATKPADPKKTNFVFDGWYSSSTLFDFTKPITSDLTLSAKWTQLFTLKYDVNGGTGTVPQPEQHKSGENVTIKGIGSISKAGYSCLGWGDGTKTYDAGDQIQITKDITLYAVWKANQCTVTFDMQEGGTPQSMTVDVGTSISSLGINPNGRTGYTFLGWYTQMQGGSKVTVINSTQTLYAHWQEIMYTVTFQTDDATYTGPKQLQVGYGELIPNPGNSIKTIWYVGDCIYSGWFQNPNGEGQTWDFSTQVVSGDMTLYSTKVCTDSSN